MGLLTEATEKGEAALGAILGVLPLLDVVMAEATMQVNRYRLVRGNLTPVTLDRAIGEVELALGKVERLFTELEEISQSLRAAVNYGNTYRETLQG